MADWFKLHENWFYEPRLQWAISEQSSVTIVWLWVLTECCRISSDTIGVFCEDYEMLGIQQMLNISPALFNNGINLLHKIKYIEVDRDKKTLKVLRWNDFQSEYLQRKARGDYLKSPIISDTIRKSPPEERRGEENRREESVVLARNAQPRFVEPTSKEIEDYALTIGFNVSGDHFIDYYRARGWRIKGSPIKDWRACVRTWKRTQTINLPKPKSKPIGMDQFDKEINGD